MSINFQKAVPKKPKKRLHLNFEMASVSWCQLDDSRSRSSITQLQSTPLGLLPSKANLLPPFVRHLITGSHKSPLNFQRRGQPRTVLLEIRGCRIGPSRIWLAERRCRKSRSSQWRTVLDKVGGVFPPFPKFAADPATARLRALTADTRSRRRRRLGVR